MAGGERKKYNSFASPNMRNMRKAIVAYALPNGCYTTLSTSGVNTNNWNTKNDLLSARRNLSLEKK